ncbi:hypothetical protein Poli38472_004237 [Pythium oligandrum]|uniref:PITH domain-containing protein n=1 Tax=Pythium oligandrum TaxID=41045 RepID=A0A8K1CMV6_PYTOL|nr:hypothetical protein Poli38472_004237 [Pythium oligandrum]|eukprot:TMW66472.1 hypothetical protein Poli38472_004237 [Pythium oligandrum]
MGKRLPEEEEVIEAISSVLEENPDFGLKRVASTLKQQNPNWTLGDKRVTKLLRKVKLVRTFVGGNNSNNQEEDEEMNNQIEQGFTAAAGFTPAAGFTDNNDPWNVAPQNTAPVQQGFLQDPWNASPAAPAAPTKEEKAEVLDEDTQSEEAETEVVPVPTKAAEPATKEPEEPEQEAPTKPVTGFLTEPAVQAPVQGFVTGPPASTGFTLDAAFEGSIAPGFVAEPAAAPLAVPEPEAAAPAPGFVTETAAETVPAAGFVAEAAPVVSEAVANAPVTGFVEEVAASVVPTVVEAAPVPAFVPEAVVNAPAQGFVDETEAPAAPAPAVVEESNSPWNAVPEVEALKETPVEEAPKAVEPVVETPAEPSWNLVPEVAALATAAKEEVKEVVEKVEEEAPKVEEKVEEKADEVIEKIEEKTEELKEEAKDVKDVAEQVVAEATGAAVEKVTEAEKAVVEGYHSVVEKKENRPEMLKEADSGFACGISMCTVISSSESIQVIRESATMQCQHEHEQCGGHGGHDHSHDHDHDHDVEDANGESLYPYIDTSKLRVLNAEDPTHVAHPFKPYHDREDHTRFLNSNEDDPEMIIYIPFTEAVSIKSICISGGEDGAHPKTVKLFTNRDDIDFSNAGELPPQQKLELVEDHIGQIDYPLQIRKFQGVSSITLFIEDSFNGDETRIYYIGMKGESKKWRHGVVEAVFESRPQAADHKVKDMMGSRALN